MRENGEETFAVNGMVTVDGTRCAGHGKCYLIAPEALEPINDDGQARWIEGGPMAVPPELAGRLARAVENCPEHALSWVPAEHEEGKR